MNDGSTAHWSVGALVVSDAYSSETLTQYSLKVYGFLVSERNRFSSQSAPVMLDYQRPIRRRKFRPRGSPSSSRATYPSSNATVRMQIARLLLTSLPPLLRITISVILRVDISNNYAGCREGAVRR